MKAKFIIGIINQAKSNDRKERDRIIKKDLRAWSKIKLKV